MSEDSPDPVGVMLLLAINNLVCFGIGVLLAQALA